MLSEIEQTRLAVSRGIDPKNRSRLGQFFTSAEIARFMASMFVPSEQDCCHLLDAGAGIGSLSEAFLNKWADGESSFSRIKVDAFEVDESLLVHLAKTLRRRDERQNVVCVIKHEDFVHVASDSIAGNLFAAPLPSYTHVILNPPYKKIRSDSAHRLALRRAGIETVNLYSAFVSLALSLLEDHGQLVAIIPRSFCNGPYYRPFRNLILERSAIRHIHLFASRSKAFRDDAVLQENVIIRLERGGQQGPVTVSNSADGRFDDLSFHEHPFNQIVFPDDEEQFIHVPTSPGLTAIELSSAIRCSLAEIGISISTGPVVDFRLKEHLRDMPGPGTVPLLYPGHFNRDGIEWPKRGFRKPNAILRNGESERWLYPNGNYCIVRRFSSKEEDKRVVARVVNSRAFPDVEMLGFENHLNVFHENRHGLPQALAHGLSVYLNSTDVDEQFRRFNGNTQVNATDLRLMKYPSRDSLVSLGTWALKQNELTQEMIDSMLGDLVGA